MGIFVPWLVDAGRLTGYPVVEISGWRDRGHGGMFSVEGTVLHHTAGPKVGEYPSLAVVRDGRPDLTGPLANLGLGRSGTVYAVAAGLSYHAGASEWTGISSLNGRFLGIEAEDDGDGAWTPEQLDCYPRLVAALLYYMRRPASRACAHRECARPLGRKPDPTGIDMPTLRTRVAQLLTDPLRLIPRPGRIVTTPTKETPVATDQTSAQIATLHTQLCTGPDPARWGWDAFPGGSTDPGGHAERFTVIDYLRKANQRNEDQMRELAALRSEMSSLRAVVEQLAKRPATQIDPSAVAAGVTAALGGGLVITGTATPKGSTP